MTTIAVSGCHGFIGSVLVTGLERNGHRVTRIERRLLDAANRAELTRLIDGCAAVIHCAGLTPRRGRRLGSDDFDTANHVYTRNVGLAAADARVERFLFVSSIAVIAGHSDVLTPDMAYNPVGAYGTSKADGEKALLAIDGLRSIIVRPPLVYGPDPKGDLGMLLKMCALPLPLPFGAVENRRSMIGVTNLVDALRFLTVANVTTAPVILHASDGRDLSLAELIATIRKGLGRKPTLLNIPPKLLEGALRIAGLGRFADKLVGDSQVDIARLIALGWTPPVEPAFDLNRMTQAFMARRARR